MLIPNRKVLFYRTLSSTQDVAYALAKKGEKEGTVVVSDYQYRGRGKLGRRWFSVRGKNLLCSVILRPSVSPQQVFLLTRSVSSCIKQVIEKRAGLKVHFKHPNDLLINKKKVGGILSEAHIKKNRIEFVILGIGINVNAKREELIPGATSLKVETGRRFSRPDLLREILDALESKGIF